MASRYQGKACMFKSFELLLLCFVYLLPVQTKYYFHDRFYLFITLSVSRLMQILLIGASC